MFTYFIFRNVVSRKLIHNTKSIGSQIAKTFGSNLNEIQNCLNEVWDKKGENILYWGKYLYACMNLGVLNNFQVLK